MQKCEYLGHVWEVKWLLWGSFFLSISGALHHIFLHSLTLTASFGSNLVVTCPLLKSPIRLGLNFNLAGTNSVMTDVMVLRAKVRRNETLDINDMFGLTFGLKNSQ